MKTPKIALTLAIVLPICGAAAAAEKIEIVGTGDGMNILKSLSAAFSESGSPARIVIPDSIGSSSTLR